MTKARTSGNTVNPADVPVILGMIARGDRKHDIAAWFGLNQGRIAEVESGTHGTPKAAPASALPPAGSPGPRSLALRHKLSAIQKAVEDGKTSLAEQIIAKAIKDFDVPV